MPKVKPTNKGYWEQLVGPHTIISKLARGKKCRFLKSRKCCMHCDGPCYNVSINNFAIGRLCNGHYERFIDALCIEEH